jgi:transposase InsO family protein
MQELSTRKINQNEIQIKGIIHNKTIKYYTYIYVWTNKNKGIQCIIVIFLLVDDYTRMTAFFFLRKKSEAFEHLNIYKGMVETDTESIIKCLRSHNGGDFTSKKFIDLCSKHEIKRQFSTTGTP